jgi:hypothetical protein
MTPPSKYVLFSLFLSKLLDEKISPNRDVVEVCLRNQFSLDHNKDAAIKLWTFRSVVLTLLQLGDMGQQRDCSHLADVIWQLIDVNCSGSIFYSEFLEFIWPSVELQRDVKEVEEIVRREMLHVLTANCSVDVAHRGNEEESCQELAAALFEKTGVQVIQHRHDAEIDISLDSLKRCLRRLHCGTCRVDDIDCYADSLATHSSRSQNSISCDSFMQSVRPLTTQQRHSIGVWDSRLHSVLPGLLPAEVAVDKEVGAGRAGERQEEVERLLQAWASVRGEGTDSEMEAGGQVALRSSVERALRRAEQQALDRHEAVLRVAREELASVERAVRGQLQREQEEQSLGLGRGSIAIAVTDFDADEHSRGCLHRLLFYTHNSSSSVLTETAARSRWDFCSCVRRESCSVRTQWLGGGLEEGRGSWVQRWNSLQHGLFTLCAFSRTAVTGRGQESGSDDDTNATIFHRCCRCRCVKNNRRPRVWMYAFIVLLGLCSLSVLFEQSKA